MVQCSIANCSSNCSQKYKEQRMTFFALPSKRKETKYRGKKAYRNALNRIVNAQNDAWMKAINLGYQDGYILPSNNYNIRLCVWHFHPSTLQWDEKSHCTLKLGASPTVYLTKFAMENDEFKEEKRFPRTVGDPKDINIVKDNFLRNNYCNESPKLPKVTPDRDNRSMKRSRVALMTLKEIIFDIIKESSIFNDAIRTCNSCYTNRLKKISLPLVNTFFNVSTNNFTLLLNRREITKKITMKMVKDQKTKNRYVSENKCTNVSTDVSTWTCNYCKTFLKSYNAIQQGNVNVLRNRCYLLQKLISNNLQWIICLSMAELKQMSTRFSSPLGTKDEMVKNIYNIMVDTFSDTSSSIVECLDRDEGVDTDA